MTVIYFVSTLVEKDKGKHGKEDKGKCGHVPSRWKKASLVFVVKKSRYCDTHWEDTIDNMWDTDHSSFIWSC